MREPEGPEEAWGVVRGRAGGSKVRGTAGGPGGRGRSWGLWGRSWGGKLGSEVLGVGEAAGKKGRVERGVRKAGGLWKGGRRVEGLWDGGGA